MRGDKILVGGSRGSSVSAAEACPSGLESLLSTRGVVEWQAGAALHLSVIESNQGILRSDVVAPLPALSHDLSVRGRPIPRRAQ